MTSLRLKRLTLLALIVTSAAFPRALEFGTSISHSYDGRNVFLNPAALGFNTELNGFGIQNSFTVNLNQNKQDEFSFGLGIGYFGFGVEKLSETLGQFTRLSFALGTPLGPHLFFGARYSFTNSDTAALDGFNSFDLGLQYRRFSFLSFGLLAETINQPVVNGARQDTNLVFATTIRPWQMLDLSIDLESPARNFADQINYQIMASLELLGGLHLRAGYHEVHKVQLGIQFGFGLGSYYLNSRPDTTDRPIAFGAQASFKPYRSIVKVPTTIKAKIDSSIHEAPAHGGLFRSGHPSFLQLLRKLDKAKNNSTVKLVFIKLDRFPLGFAAAQDLHELLLEIRKSGKRVEIALGTAGEREYFIATAANKVYLDPGGSLELLGLRRSRYFFKGTLDKLGIKAEVFAKGKYKSAPEQFTQTKSSEIHRSTVLKDLKKAELKLKSIMAQGRPSLEKDWDKIHQHALFSPIEAKQFGLIDEIYSYPTILETIENRTLVRSEASQMSSALRLPDRISVIVASGAITSSRTPFTLLGGMDNITPKKFGDQLDAALSDPRTKAIVVRVASGGGGVLPSQQIADMVRNANEVKPVFVSMADIAASGGYMIAAPASKIFAQDLTLTGSIGVFLGKPNLSGLYKKIGVSKETLSHFPNASLYSESKALTRSETKILKRRLDSFYESFITYVAKYRNLSKEQVDRVAQGRVWLGFEANQKQLLDGNKGYLATLRAAAKSVGISEHFQYRIVQTDRPLLSFFQPEVDWVRSTHPALSLVDERLLGEFPLLHSDSPFLYRTPFGPIE